MGDFAAPAAAANGSSICINNNLNSSLGGAGVGVNSTPHGPPAAAPGNNNANGGGVPKHSTVVERLRQRIEGCRRHHVSCESRYQQAQAEQLELERRDTVSLYQRTLEQRAKKTGTGGSKQQQSKQQQDAEPAAAEQRNHTLIMVRGCGPGAGGRVCVCPRPLPVSRRDELEVPPLSPGGGRGSPQLWWRRGAAGRLRNFSHWWGGGGSGQTFFPPLPRLFQRREEAAPRGKREGAVPSVRRGAAESQRRV